MGRPRKYAHKEDVDKIEKRLDGFFGNEWPHLTAKVWVMFGILSVLILLVILILDKVW